GRAGGAPVVAVPLAAEKLFNSWALRTIRLVKPYFTHIRRVIAEADSVVIRHCGWNRNCGSRPGNISANAVVPACHRRYGVQNGTRYARMRPYHRALMVTIRIIGSLV
ncbi:hypothetical protein, partial [Agrobacterium tumefaciens]|uniref:hypothetical protein n=2 Tax=Agrobacterium tumefaciens TaxID=358 RepID=UPI001BAD345E